MSTTIWNGIAGEDIKDRIGQFGMDIQYLKLDIFQITTDPQAAATRPDRQLPPPSNNLQPGCPIT
jgi:hypothetical protein